MRPNSSRSSASYSKIELLYEALRSPFGTVVESEDPERLRQQLYPLRKEDPDLAVLSFVISPFNPTTDLWIVKNEGRRTAEGDT